MFVYNPLDLGYHDIIPNKYGYYIDKVSKEILNSLKPTIDSLQKDFNQGEKLNDKLVGEIEHEYKILIPPLFKNYLKTLFQKIETNTEHMYHLVNGYSEKDTLNQNQPILHIKDLWVNFQKKYEYNPMHRHSGLYSFVLWYQIPYLMENEYKYQYKSTPSNCSHGTFHFILPTPFDLYNHVGDIELKVDKRFEGYIAIFPSSLHHLVYPFYSSNDYRITISGNIELNTHDN